MIVASVVFPRPGGPTRRTWSSASPLPRVASSAISSCSFVCDCPTKSAKSPRSERLLDLFVALLQRGRQELRGSCGAPQRLADALFGRQLGVGVRQRLLRLDDGVAELDEGVPRDDMG